MRLAAKSHPAEFGVLVGAVVLFGAWMLSSTAAVLPTDDFVLLALAAQFQTYGTITFARHGDAGGLLALAIALGLMAFVGATGAVLIAATVLTLWISFPTDIPARYWLHTLLPIILPAVLMMLTSLALGRAMGSRFLDVDLPLERGWSHVALLVVALITGALLVQAMGTEGRLLRANAHAALAAALVGAAASAAALSSLGLVVAMAWYAAALGTACVLQGLARKLAGAEAS